jgi:hypothetical protein
VAEFTLNIEKEWFFPSVDQEYSKKTSKGEQKTAFFYVILLQKERTRYLKVGTTTKTPLSRFNMADYKKYNFIKPIYIAEVSSTKGGEQGVLHIEDLTKGALRELKGFNHIKQDRFTYFQLPPTIPIYTKVGECYNIILHENQILPIEES